MRRSFAGLLVPAATIVAAGAALLAGLPSARQVLPPQTPDPTPALVSGVSHVHSSRSDGTGSPDEIAAAAARAGLDFVIFTDHGDATREPDPPQYRSGVLCLDAVEISTTGGHYIAVGLPRAPYPLGGEPRDVVEDVRRLGGFGIVAHPHSDKPELQWQDWDAPVDAVEWLNGDSEWRDESFARLARAVATYPVRPVETVASLLDRPEATLRRWDELTADRPIVGLPGSDAHARLGWGGEADEPYRRRVLLRIPSYETLFSVFSMRVELARPWSGVAADAAASLLTALRGGRLHSVVDGLAGPAALEFVARSGSREARQGQTLVPDGPVTVSVRSNGPPGTSIALLRGGVPLSEVQARELRMEIPPGPAVLRVEVRLGDDPSSVPWIVSNPIYLLSPVGPQPPEPVGGEGEPDEEVRLDVPGAERGWHFEQSPASSGALEREGDGPTRVRYTLAAETTGAFVALTVPAPELPRFERVSMRASVEAPMRLSVQLRRPDGADGQRWRRSVYLDGTPRDIVVSFREMTPIGAAETPTPDMPRVGDLLLTVDTVNAAPGTSGAFSFEHLRLER